MEWSNLYSTLLGAGVSIATSLVVFGFTSWSETKRQRKMERKAEAFRAFCGFQKLLRAANSIANLKRHIDEAFQEAEEHGVLDGEPASKVRPVVSAEIDLQPVAAEEMFFLIEGKRSQMMGEIELIYHRSLNNIAASKAYSVMRLEFDRFLESQTSSINDVEGAVVSFNMKGLHEAVAGLRVGMLNNMLGQLMENLESDVPEARRLCEAFLQAAKEQFGKDFPNVKLEWKN
jgi:hypothetical protein